MTTIGVLAIQGAISEHIDMLKSLGVKAVPVKKAGTITGLDGLVIPGGESTTIGRLINLFGLKEEIMEIHRQGKPILGTCAGMVILSARVEGQEPVLGLLDATCRRNAFGRQRESFETGLRITALGADPFPGVFIRAPLLTETGPKAQVLASLPQGIVAARQENLIAVSFHPELTDDPRLHKYFLSLLN